MTTASELCEVVLLECVLRDALLHQTDDLNLGKMTTAQLCNGGTVNTLSILSLISVCGEVQQCRPGISLVSLVTLQLESTTLMNQVMKLATLIQSWTDHTDIMLQFLAHNSQLLSVTRDNIFTHF